LEKLVIVEVDGGQHNQQKSYDDKRDAWLRAEGFTVLRFWDHEVLTQINEVKQAIWKVLSVAPCLVLPRGGGEEN
jgi:very-short-patch-repair endonuclease